MIRTRGFTLIEVLVALAIVAVTLAAGARAAGSVVDSAQRLRDVTLAQWCADNQLTELKLGRVFPGLGESNFSCLQAGQELRGRQTVRSTPNPNFVRVDARIVDAGDHTLFMLSTVMSRY